MNRYQRGVLIGAGLIIAVIQLYGIGNSGLEHSRGWAVSFLIAAFLLLVGLGSWKGFGAFLNKANLKIPTQSGRAVTHPSSVKSSPVRSQHNKPDKYEYGIHISELDIAIQAHKKYAEKEKLFCPLEGNAKSLNWNCCASIYASMRYAARKTEMRINNIVWNTIISAIVVRMSTEENEDASMGNAKYKQLEEDAYADVERINKAVEDAISEEGAYAIEPIVTLLAIMFGSKGKVVKALSAVVLLNAEAARKKILPEILEDLS